jgi:hypothetical protein
MERKLVLCCLALLLLGGFAIAGNTPWPKFTGSPTGTHYYINLPNAQGGNGEGDSALVLYLSSEFVPGDSVIGLNVESYDFNGGVNGFSYKALELRYESAVTPGCPDWIAAPLGAVPVVPYISNYPNLTQYPFAAPAFPPPAFNTVCTLQYSPGQNCVNPGCPLVAGNTGTASGFSYLWDALGSSCAGLSVDWSICLYGNKQPPDVLPRITLINDKYGTDSDTTAMTEPTGLKMVVHLENNAGTSVSANLSLFVRGGVSGTGFSGTGMDLLSGLSSGTILNPLPVFIPPISLGGTVPIKLGALLEYNFSAYTFEGLLTSTGTPPLNVSYETDMQCTPVGCQDDNTLEANYFVQSPQVWGDGYCKRFTEDLLPSGAFTVDAIDWCPGDFGGAGSPLFKVELRSDGTFGDGFTPDLSTAGWLASFDTSSGPGATLVRRTANTPASFAGPPATPIYLRCLFDASYFLVALGSDLSGTNHKGFADSAYSLGGGTGPDGETLPFNQSTITLIIRLVTGTPADGDFSGNGSVANIAPSIALAK